MTSAHILASGPVRLRATSLQSCRDRHVHHVVGCSNQQRDSTLKWGRKPATKVQAVSEEVIEGLDLHSTHEGNGASQATAPVTQSTLSVHAGESGGRPKVADSLTTPICCTSTYYFQDTAELIAYQEGRYGSYEYGRLDNGLTCLLILNWAGHDADFPLCFCLLHFQSKKFCTQLASRCQTPLSQCTDMSWCIGILEMQHVDKDRLVQTTCFRLSVKW